MNPALFSVRNIAIIAAFTILFHVALHPVYDALDGDPST
jgi:hypothetical protein